MRQVFRLMGAPDKIIAFDELPARLVKGIELCRADGFPRHWKEWLGKTSSKLRVNPEIDPLTKQVRTYPEIDETDYYFYLIDWNLRPSCEKWDDICDFAKRVVAKDVRLTDKISDMAKPLAPNKTDGISLEPEDVVVIPIPLEFQEKSVKIVSPSGVEVELDKTVPERKNVVQCEQTGCNFEATGAYAKTSLRMHMKKHKEKISA